MSIKLLLKKQNYIYLRFIINSSIVNMASRTKSYLKFQVFSLSLFIFPVLPFLRNSIALLIHLTHLIHLILEIVKRNIHRNGGLFACIWDNVHKIIGSLNTLTPTPDYFIAVFLQLKLFIYFGEMRIKLILSLLNVAWLTPSKSSTARPIFQLN
jgi:hypothetical protein